MKIQMLCSFDTILSGIQTLANQAIYDWQMHSIIQQNCGSPFPANGLQPTDLIPPWRVRLFLYGTTAKSSVYW